MAFPEKNYTLGSYKVFFDKFAAGTKVGTGQRYFGNTPALSKNSESETLDHFDADNGIRTKDDSVVLELNRNGSFTTDHISPENLALFFLGEDSVVVQGGSAGLTYAITDAQKGRRYQIGATPSVPAGVRGLANVVVEVATVAKTAGVDYTVDLTDGGLIILEGGTIADGDDVDVEYDLVATSYNRVVSSDNAEIYGALYLKSNNAKGLKQDYFMPYVQIRPDGDFEMKGEEWQELPFSFEILKLDDNTPAVYINGRPGEGI
jgi:hypothetical protein